MNNLIIDILQTLPKGTKLSTILMVIDYILCTSTIATPEEATEVLGFIVDINQLLRKNWHAVFDDEIVSLALQGKVKTKTGEAVDKGVEVTHKLICNKRASLYKEKEPSICDMAGTVRDKLLTITGTPTAPV